MARKYTRRKTSTARKSVEVSTVSRSVSQPTGLLLWVVAVIILAFGLFLIIPERQSTLVGDQTEQQVSEITYQGVEGKNALELLKASHQVETTQYGEDEFVTSIDGVKGDDTHFWLYSVNGQPAEVAADNYQTKNTDTITWKYEQAE